MNPNEILNRIAETVINGLNCDGIDCKTCVLYTGNNTCLAHGIVKNHNKLISINNRK